MLWPGDGAGRGAGGRTAAGAGVIALHLLVLWAFITAGRLHMPPASIEPVMAWLSIGDAPARPITPAPAPARTAMARRPSLSAIGQPVPLVAAPADLPRPTAITPPAASTPDIAPAPAIYWRAAATAGARAALDGQARQRHLEQSMGAAPQSTARAATPHPAFPWGHQPMGKHYDIQGGVLLVRTKRCVFGVFVILPGFSCNPGRIDPEPGQGDLFDPKYAPPPLEVPRPLVDDPLK